jgi:hypothetical protein
MNILILLQLLLAHILTDFVFQTQSSVKQKKDNGFKSYHLWLHIFISGLLTYIVLQDWTNWKIPLIVIITHGIIDYWKILQERKIDRQNQVIEQYNSSNNYKKDEISGAHYFFIDQALHLTVIILIWLCLIGGYHKVIPFSESLFNNEKRLIILTAVIFISLPAGILIGKITEQFRLKIDNNDSLKNAGKYIGIFERLLVFIFVLNLQFGAIGFLIASKSILRISKSDDEQSREKTEYVLVGTLISFFIAIIIGLLVNYVLKIK